MSLIVYGIKNCNTVKAALVWLKEKNIDFEFHDFKTRGVEAQKLKSWSTQVGWEKLVNTRGTTWRQLLPGAQSKIKDQAAAIALMKEKTSVIKRPVIESGSRILAIGFDAETYQKKIR